MRLDRDASARLVLLLDCVPDHTGDADRIRRILTRHFDAVFGSADADPLGDSAWQPFTIRGLPFEIRSDIWTGLSLTALSPDGDPVLRSIVERLLEPDQSC